MNRNAKGQFQTNHLYLKAATIVVAFTVLVILGVLATVGSVNDPTAVPSTPVAVPHVFIIGHTTIQKGGE